VQQLVIDDAVANDGDVAAHDTDDTTVKDAAQKFLTHVVFTITVDAVHKVLKDAWTPDDVHQLLHTVSAVGQVTEKLPDVIQKKIGVHTVELIAKTLPHAAAVRKLVASGGDDMILDAVATVSDVQNPKKSDTFEDLKKLRGIADLLQTQGIDSKVVGALNLSDYYETLTADITKVWSMVQTVCSNVCSLIFLNMFAFVIHSYVSYSMSMRHAACGGDSFSFSLACAKH
jgi:hypothetical protein